LKDPVLSGKVCNMILGPCLADTEKTRILLPNGSYVRTHDTHKLHRLKRSVRFSAQEFLIDQAEGREQANGFSIADLVPAPISDLLFTNTPVESPEPAATVENPR
jgi:hypothetical protein